MNDTSVTTETSYIYVIVRKDIALEHQLVQVGHAAHEAGAHYGNKTETPNLVLLEVESAQALQRAAFKLERQGVAHRLFFEPDYDLGYCALATEPVRGRKHRACFKGYALYKHAA